VLNAAVDSIAAEAKGAGEQWRLHDLGEVESARRVLVVSNADIWLLTPRHGSGVCVRKTSQSEIAKNSDLQQFVTEVGSEVVAKVSRALTMSKNEWRAAGFLENPAIDLFGNACSEKF
jgi:hypothetical protein